MKDEHPGIHTGTTCPCLLARRKGKSSVTLRIDVHPSIHIATTSPCLTIRQKSAFRDAAVFSDTQKTCALRHLRSHDKYVFSDTAKDGHPGIHTVTTSLYLVTRQNCSVQQKICAPWNSHGHDKSASSDTAKTLAFGDAHTTCAPQLATEKSTFRDVAAFSDAHKRGTPAGACSPDKSACSGAAAFNDSQISRTSLRAQQKQAFRGVAAFSGT